MKKINFSFFPSVRFLGLSLKILFHKNKEIKRMLSKKMAFSLMGLITIFALAFVVPSAMAAEFTVSLGVGSETDVSFADGDQIEIAGTGPTTTAIMVTFGVVVDSNPLGIGAPTKETASQVDSKTDFGADDIQIIAYNKFGGTATGVTFDSTNDEYVVPADPANGKEFTVSLERAASSTAVKVLLFMAKHGVEKADPRANLDAGVRTVDGKSAEASLEVHYVAAQSSDTDLQDPTVISISKVGDALLPVTGATFDVLITLSEMPKKDGFKKDQIDVTNATAADPVAIAPMKVAEAFDDNDDLKGAADRGTSTGRDGMHHRYVVTITPKYENKDDIVVKVKMFYDQETVSPNSYRPKTRAADYDEGDDKLTVKVGKEPVKPSLKAGIRVSLAKDIVIPAGGYLIVAEDAGASQIIAPVTGNDKTPDASVDLPAQLTYKLIGADIPNLETLLNNGGVIDVEGPPALVISEIMWGSDASLVDSTDSQWIELYNAGAEYKTVDNDAETDANEAVTLVFYGPADTLPAIADVNDRVGTVDVNGAPWSAAGIGQSGRTGTAEKVGDLVAIVPTQRVISMQRAIATDGTVSDGQDASSWTQSAPPGLNFKADAVGIRVANPGTGSFTFADPVVEVVEVVVPVAETSDLMITEIMVDTGGGRLPQWIEITNVSGAEVGLAGWSVGILNSEDDADAVGTSVGITLSGTLGVGGGEDAGGTLGKSLLLVAWASRSSSNLDGSDRVINVSSQVGEVGRYTLISEMAFEVALIPPQKTGVLALGDTVGNLDGGWELPTAEGARSSLIRRESDAAGMATMGTMANGWVLASDTALVSGPATWYGSDEDAGTPGYDAGGPLPVELSHFRPARDKDTGAAVITWSTQSELNNAGFFIKRSQQRDGQFKVINAAMIQGAGTTSEKQFYIYTDTTAQPNVVYYYQIEDVSLDGNHQTLTNGIRLKGHIGAAGKLTTTWGDLKTSQ